MLCKSDIEQLFRKYYGDMYSLAVTILHDEEEARDAVSSVFARLLDKRDAASINLSYLLISVRWQCLNRISHMKVKEKAMRLLPLDTETATPSVYDDEELLEKIRLFIDSELTDKTRSIIYRHYADDMSYNDIAKEQGISRQAVYKHILHAVEKLKKHFGKTTRRQV